ncbi:ATP-binding protein [Streptomyces atratus]|uniref:ATP-binding protein n=1 Tax=Streptomyces TaxID=1883 RepID=UPI00379D729D
MSDPEPSAWPVLRTAAGGDESGRGVSLVDALALRWGVEQGPYGKTVWCELRAPASCGSPVYEPTGPGRPETGVGLGLGRSGAGPTR